MCVLHRQRLRRAFTLIELLIVIAIIAILAVVVILVLNPAQLLKESRDAKRLSDAATIKSSIALYSEDIGGSLGSSSVIYVSIPDPLATSSAGDQCQGLGLPSLASDTYQCASSTTYRNTNGTGWIPVNLKNISFSAPILTWPVDPINTTSTGEFYTYEASDNLYETTMVLESTKYAATEASDGGAYVDLYEQGTNLALAPVDFYAATGGAGGESGGGGGSFNGFAYERAITITSNTTLASGTLSNFPMLFSGTYSWLEASSSGGKIQNLAVAPNGETEPADLTFSASSACTSPLNFETERYVSSTGAIVDWVNVPSLSAGTIIYACYSNSSVATDQSNALGTWNSNYLGVWHMSENNDSSLNLDDSTSYANNGTIVGTLSPTTGQINAAANFSGNPIGGVAKNYIELPNLGLVGNVPFTISLWINASSTYLLEIMSFGTNGAEIEFLYGYPTVGKLGLYPGSAPGNISLDPNTWHNVVAAYDGVGTTNVYVDGAFDFSQARVINLNNANYDIGASGPQGNEYGFNGSLDEARVSNIVLTPSWILTQYNNQVSPNTFYAVGSEL